MDLSVCILNWNTAPDLRRCLGSVFSARYSSIIQVIVVDNASDDGSAEIVRREFPQATLIQNSRNVGFAAGHNRGIRASSGRYLLLLNADTIVHEGALTALVRAADAHPRAAVVGPRLLNADGSLQYSCRRFPRLAYGLFRKAPLGRLLPENRFDREYLMRDFDHTREQTVDWVSGAAFLLRREAVEQVGLLDEGYYMYCEDVDWCYRARRKDWQVLYAPRAVVTHLHGRSTDMRPFAMSYQFHRSMARFYRKHYAGKWPAVLRWAPEMGIWLRAGIVLGEHGVEWWRNVLRRGWRQV